MVEAARRPSLRDPVECHMRRVPSGHAARSNQTAALLWFGGRMGRWIPPVDWSSTTARSRAIWMGSSDTWRRTLMRAPQTSRVSRHFTSPPSKDRRARSGCCWKPEPSVDAQDAFGNTPLFRAVFNSRGQGETVEELLRAGANPDLPNHSGVTPRGLAHSIANYDVAQFLPPTDEST